MPHVGRKEKLPVAIPFSAPMVGASDTKKSNGNGVFSTVEGSEILRYNQLRLVGNSLPLFAVFLDMPSGSLGFLDHHPFCLPWSL